MTNYVFFIRNTVLQVLNIFTPLYSMLKSFTLYPIYFDPNRKLSKGRKFNLESCFPNPTNQEIVTALKFLEIEHEVDPSKRHPCEPFVYGRVRIPKKYDKKMVLSGIKNIVEDNRKNRAVLESKILKTEVKKGYVKNSMNLVPKKKNKKKK